MTLRKPFLVLAIVASVAVAIAFATGRASAVFAAFAVDFLFFGGLAAGAIALCAIFVVAGARWPAALVPFAERAGAFLAPALSLLVLASIGARLWMPWAPGADAESLVVLAVRDVVAGAALLLLAARFRARPTPTRGVVFLLAYAAGLSVVAFDLVMSLYDGEQSTVEPALFFVGALLSALALSIAVALTRADAALGEETRHDAGKLLFALATFWAYLVWSAYLPTWYANIPDEGTLLLARVRGGWWAVTAFTLVATALGPFFLLLLESARKNRAVLRGTAILVVCGIVGETALLVLPDLRLDAVDFAVIAIVSLGVAAAFATLPLRTASTPPRA